MCARWRACVRAGVCVRSCVGACVRVCVCMGGRVCVACVRWRASCLMRQVPNEPRHSQKCKLPCVKNRCECAKVPEKWGLRRWGRDLFALISIGVASTTAREGEGTRRCSLTIGKASDARRICANETSRATRQAYETHPKRVLAYAEWCYLRGECKAQAIGVRIRKSGVPKEGNAMIAYAEYVE